MLSSGLLHAQPICTDLLASTESNGNTGLAVELKAWFSKWDQQMIDEYNLRATPRSIPTSWKIPAFRRKRIEHNLYQTGGSILGSLRQVQQEVENGNGEGITAKMLLETLQNDISKNHFFDKFTIALKKREFENFKNSTNKVVEQTGAQDIPFSLMQEFIQDYRSEVERYRAVYGKDIFPEDAVVKAGFDVFSMFMLSEILGVEIPSKKSVYALALLHPITDSALDSGIDIRQSMNKITTRLSGESVTRDTPFEVAVFDFIDQILEDFPPNVNPMAQTLLQELHKSQLASVKIQAEAEEEALLENTLRKGALTYLLFAHLGLGELSVGQAKYFYKAGGVLQLIDDMLDITEDQKSSQATVWTLALLKTKRLKKPFLKMMRLHKSLEREGEALLEGFDNKEKILTSFDFSLKLFVLSAMTDPQVGPKIVKEAKGIAPMTARGMSQISTNLLDTMYENPGAEQDLLKILDGGFLGGRYYGDLANGRTPEIPKRLNLAGKSPKWMMIKFRDSAHRWLKRDLQGSRSKLVLIAGAYFTAHLHLSFQNISNSSASDQYSMLYLMGYFSTYHLAVKQERPVLAFLISLTMMGGSYFL